MATRAEQFRSRHQMARAREQSQNKQPHRSEGATQRLLATLNRAFLGPQALAALRDFFAGNSQKEALPEPDPYQPSAGQPRRRRRSKKEADVHLKAATPLKAKQLLKTTSPSERHNKRGSS